MKRFAEFIVRRRLLLLSVIGLLTVFFGYNTRMVEMYTSFSDLLPKSHPYIDVHNEFRSIFGGANLVLLSVEVKKGDIFNTETLEKIKRLTEAVELTPGVNNYQIFSIARQKVKDVRASSWGVVVKPVMWPDIPTTPESLRQLRQTVYANPAIGGRLVSLDGKAALVTAAFHEERLSYDLLFRRIHDTIEEVRDDNTAVYAAGEPILYGWIYHFLHEIAFIMGLTCLMLLGLLALYYRSLNGVVIPVISALVTFIWGVGLTALLGYNFEPLVMVVPFLIAARTISHSIQFRERFFDAFAQSGDKEEAAIESASGLLMPGSVSILTDAMGLIVLLIAPMPILNKLAIAGSFWVITNIVSVEILDPILCCYFPAPKNRLGVTEKHWLDTPLRSLGWMCTARHGRWLVLIVFGAIALWSLYWNQFLTVGDSRPGSSLLWPDSDYNVSVRKINEKFYGTDHLYIILKGNRENVVKSPAILRNVEALQRHMKRSAHVGGTDSIVALVRRINTVLHDNDSRWGVIPRSDVEVGGLLMLAEHGTEPGDFDRWVNYNFQHANVSVFLRDHRGPTIRDVIRHAKAFISQHPMAEAEFKLAGGLVGVLAAANEVLERSHSLILGVILAAQFVLCAVGFRSFLAGLLFVGVVLLSNTFAMALMARWNVGLNVNTLPVISLGIGFGVDYGIYIVARIIEEYRRQRRRDLRCAIAEGIATAGRAVVYTAVLIAAAISPWSFSPLRFQAEMGYQLLIILLMNMFGALLLLPALMVVIQPRFVLGKRDASDPR